MAGDGFEGFQTPQLGVEFGRKTVEKHAVSRQLLLAQHALRIAYVDGEQHLTLLKRQPVHARQQPPPLGGQLLGQRAQIIICRHAAQQIFSLHGVSLDRDKVQHARALGVGLPGGPGGQKIQTEAKAGFQNAPLRLSSPCLGQAATCQKRQFGLIAPA